MDFRSQSNQLSSIRNAIYQAKSGLQNAATALTNTYNNVINDCNTLSNVLSRSNVVSNWRDVVNLVKKIQDNQRRCVDYNRQIDKYAAELKKQEQALEKVLGQLPTRM